MFVYLSSNFLLQESGEEPAVYTKLACFLPWIAEQYEMDFVGNTGGESKECTQGNGDKNDYNIVPCRSNSLEESECIFPFYWNGKLFDQCTFIEDQEFQIPVFRCPIRNITRKIDGINSFKSEDFLRYRGLADVTRRLCVANDQDKNDPTAELDPEIEYCFPGIQAFAQCKNNCKGGKDMHH